MSDLPARVERAFRDHDSFEPVEDSEDTYASVTTAFDGRVRATESDDGRTRFEVTVRVPMLDEVTEDEVAPIVEEGWAETFALRVEDVGGITTGEADLEPDVREAGREVVASVTFAELDPRRGVDDAAAFIDFVEGTYVQGVIPGYDYEEPVTSLVSNARATGGSGGA